MDSPPGKSSQNFGFELYNPILSSLASSDFTLDTAKPFSEALPASVAAETALESV